MNLLEQAAELIETNGWAQGAWYEPQHGYCMLGALSQAAGFDPSMEQWDRNQFPSPELDDAWGALMVTCQERYGTWDVPEVNDDHLKDKYEAIDVLRDAAKRLPQKVKVVA